MEETIDYLEVKPGRRGKVFVGGYIDATAGDRLRKAAELNGCTMVELLELMAGKVTVTFEGQGCGCCE